jgi:predicted cupin superfamily sugar epimerase
MMTPEDMIRLLDLQPLPVEGGHFRQTWCARDIIPASVLDARYGRAKPAGTAIYYLLTNEPDSFSALHRLPTDEVYHFYLGAPVQQLLLRPDGSHEVVTLGPELASGQRVQSVVPKGVWQGSRLWPGGRFALLGTTMAPGFDVQDYEGGDREWLIERYPAVTDLIRTLTHC